MPALSMAEILARTEARITAERRKRLVWVVLNYGKEIGRRTTLRAAKGMVTRPYFPSNGIRVFHVKSGEIWYRRDGSWFVEQRAGEGPPPYSEGDGA